MRSWLILLPALMWSHESPAGIQCPKNRVRAAIEQLEIARKGKCLPRAMSSLDTAIKALQGEATCNQAIVTRIKRSVLDARVQSLLKEAGDPCDKLLDAALADLKKL